MSVDLGISASPSWPLDSGQREVEVMGASVVTLKKAALCKYRPKTLVAPAGPLLIKGW